MQEARKRFDKASIIYDQVHSESWKCNIPTFCGLSFPVTSNLLPLWSFTPLPIAFKLNCHACLLQLECFEQAGKMYHVNGYNGGCLCLCLLILVWKTRKYGHMMQVFELSMYMRIQEILKANASLVQYGLLSYFLIGKSLKDDDNSSGLLLTRQLD